jgi:DNA polymerase-3 subunit delta'
MAFRDFPNQKAGIGLLQRSLERGRLGHAYLFAGSQVAELEALASTLAKTLNCLNPLRKNGAAVDCCDECVNCRKIEHANHGDVFWIRPESKLRVIKINQITHRDDSPPRVLIEFINLKPTEGEYKVAIISGADRMNDQAANAFLKTLEEPPAKSIIVLLTTEPQRMLETIVSRCLRLNFPGLGRRGLEPAHRQFLDQFGAIAASPQKSLIGRYKVIDVLLKQLTAIREQIEEALTAQSPLLQHKEADKNLKEQWEDELKAAIEAEYRRQRADLLGILHGWLHDAWIYALARSGGPTGPGNVKELLMFPEIAGAENAGRRINSRQALQNLQILDQLQRWLHTNVQEALALEVGLLKLNL